MEIADSFFIALQDILYFTFSFAYFLLLLSFVTKPHLWSIINDDSRTPTFGGKR